MRQLMSVDAHQLSCRVGSLPDPSFIQGDSFLLRRGGFFLLEISELSGWGGCLGIAFTG